MNPFHLSSCEDFEDYCLRAYMRFLEGDLFPYSLKDTHHLVYPSWEEAVKDVTENGIEGFSYQKGDDGDYLLCMMGFTQHVVMKDKTGKLVSSFCNNTCEEIVNSFDIPRRYEAKVVKGDNGRVKIIHIPINGHQPKSDDPRYSGIMEANGDLRAKIGFDRFLQTAGFSIRTADIAQAFGMPEEGLLCVLEQNGIIVPCEEDDDNTEDAGFSWELAEPFKGKVFVMVETNAEGKPENRWTYKGFFFIYLLLTKDCGIHPCCVKEQP